MRGNPAVVNPGQLRHQITWQQKNVTGQNSIGEDIYTWVNFLTCRASVEATVGREYQQIMQRWAESDFMITQHFYKGVAPEMRIAWFVDGSITYLDVLDVSDPLGTGRLQQVVCRTFGGTFTAA